MAANTKFYKECKSHFSKLLANYNFSHVDLKRDQYNCEHILYRKNSSIKDEYILISAFDDFRDPCCNIVIKLGIGQKLDEPRNKYYSSININELTDSIDYSAFELNRESIGIDLCNTLIQFENIAKYFLQGDIIIVENLINKH